MEAIILSCNAYGLCNNTIFYLFAQQPKDSKINVSTLKTCRDGAILDPDDILSDVADDREQVISNKMIDENEVLTN